MIKKAIVINRDAIENFLMSIKNAIKRNKRRSIVITIVGVLAIAGAAALAAYREGRITHSMTEYATIMNQYEKDLDSIDRTEPDIAKRDTAKQALHEKTALQLESLSKKFFWGSVPGNAQYAAAGCYFLAGKNDESLALYRAFADGNGKSFLRPLALFQAALCLERKGDTAGALAEYLKIEKDYAKTEFNARIMYDLGRMTALNGDKVKAKNYFSKVKTQYPQSVYATFATQRLTLLGAQ